MRRLPFVRGDMIERVDAHGRVAVRNMDGILRVDIEGDPSGEDLVSCFFEALDSGLIVPAMPALVDLGRYSGNVPWESIREITTRAAKDMGGGKPRIAYTGVNPEFDSLLKVAGALYPDSTHRAFQDADQALAWLKA